MAAYVTIADINSPNNQLGGFCEQHIHFAADRSQSRGSSLRNPAMRAHFIRNPNTAKHPLYYGR
jgi:hypothetical protein